MSPRSARLAVVGGGPAGLSAAIAAAQAGIAVTLFDEQPVLGGQLRYRIAEIDAGEPYGTLRANALRTRLLAEAETGGVALHPGAVVWGLFADNELAITDRIATYTLRAEQLILATGSTDRPLPVTGTTLPGVLTARALQILVNQYRVLPATRFAVVGAGAAANEVAEDIRLAGGDVVVQFDPGARLDRVTITGRDGVDGITCDGEPNQVEIVVLAAGRQPDNELAQMAECNIIYAGHRGGFVPVRDGDLRTSEPRILVAGDAAGIGAVGMALSEGRLAGLSAAAALGANVDAELAAARAAIAAQLEHGSAPLPSAMPRSFDPGAVPETVPLCRCEEISAAQVRQAIAAGARSINDVKRRTRAGMGICQGIFCSCLVAAEISTATGLPRADLLPMTARPPVRLIPLGDLAAMKEG